MLVPTFVLSVCSDYSAVITKSGFLFKVMPGKNNFLG